MVEHSDQGAEENDNGEHIKRKDKPERIARSNQSSEHKLHTRSAVTKQGGDILGGRGEGGNTPIGPQRHKPNAALQAKGQ